MSSTIHIFGIRHHGPGSARSVRRALDELRPDCVLIEGPPDADALIPFIGQSGMVPPVAILVHVADKPAQAVYYPFADFSPEWQAIRWAIEHTAVVRFMDLPQSHRAAIDELRIAKLTAEMEERAANEAAGETESPDLAAEPMPILPTRVERDPLQRLAEAAGFDDGERWWEHVVESQANHGTEVFTAIREAMAELRSGAQPSADPDEALREAWMRRTIRAAIKEGHATIAVVCGAWHTPALDIAAVPKKQDDDLLKGLPSVKTAAAWVPWTYDRLTFASGYGAGVRSPGWYEHLWQSSGKADSGAVLESWMTRVARLLREKDIDCSSAHVIEAVRLGQSLAAMRGRPMADLSDIADATGAVFCFDSDLAMRLIDHELLVGIRMGELPDDVPMLPLQQDLQRLQKRLRLKPEAQDRELDLDLRNDIDRQRSMLLHRLKLLGIVWGTPRRSGTAGKGTFREMWMLRWEPAFAVPLIEAGMLGNTVERAAEAKLVQLARDSNDLKTLADHLQDAMLADLGDAARALVRRIEDVAAVASDIILLMETLPPLASLMRYGNVRETDETMVRDVIDGMLPRITLGLPGAVASLNDDAAAAAEVHISATHTAVGLIDIIAHKESWEIALGGVIDQTTVHGLVRGRCTRLLLDAGRLDNDAVGQRLSQTLSRGSDPAQAARWLEGFLRGSGLLLIHDPKLLTLIDEWVGQINGDLFQELLPLLRRTFSTLPAGERRQIGQIVRTPGIRSTATPGSSRGADFNRARAARSLPLIVQLLGGSI